MKKIIFIALFLAATISTSSAYFAGSPFGEDYFGQAAFEDGAFGEKETTAFIPGDEQVVFAGENVIFNGENVVY